MSYSDSRADRTGVVVQPPLPQAVGYAIVVVVGIIIATVMIFITRLLKNTLGEDNKKTEMFMTANRTVRTGLTASAVVSSWLWSTALLGSSLVGYNYGVAGPFWFAAGCSPMIVFFALLGVSCKRKIPEAHTSLEVVRVRYGRVAHVVFMILCLINNIFACANMLLGASAVISAMTGMHVIAVTFLLPLGVSLYTFVGGIKATFLTDYFHTVVIVLVACYFSIKAFTFSEIGSAGNLYDLVQAAGARNPVSGNAQGTYLTMTSKDVTLSCSEFLIRRHNTDAILGNSIWDYPHLWELWPSDSFAASPAAVVPGYTIGGIAYFAIPWALGTVMSCVAVGLENTPVFPTYPRRMTTSEVSSGLVLPFSALTIAGSGGAAAVILITFMAVTSTLSAQVIAVSSIISFDIYREYFNKSASDRQIIRWSHFGVVFFAFFSAAFSTMLYYVGADLQWTLYMLGVVTCPGIFPMAFTVLWRGQNTLAAILAPILGLVTGLAVWITTAHYFYGAVTVSSTGQVIPYFKKEHLAVEKLDSDLTTTHHVLKSPESQQQQQHNYEDPASAASNAKELQRWGRIAGFWSVATFLGHWVIWPLPMYGSRYIFGKGFFIAWVIVSIVWLWLTMLMVTFYPLIDGGIEQTVFVFKQLIGRDEKGIRERLEFGKRKDRSEDC
uniref:Putative urea active transporter 1 n=1 Tax=Talaromyces marneffei PM1 TaxID=1077442 RepID=A0A093VK61_TALMA